MPEMRLEPPGTITDLPLRSLDPKKLPCTQRDITSTDTFKNVKKRFEEFLKPGTDTPVDFDGVAFSPDGKRIAGVATICKELRGSPTTRLAIVNVRDGKLTVYGDLEGSDSSPKWSPDGKTIAFISQIDGRGQLHLLDVASGDVKVTKKVKGNVEQVSWSPDGKKILVLVAGMGASIPGAGGGKPLDPGHGAEDGEDWMPAVRTIKAQDAYRTIWTYEVSSGESKLATPPDLNFWEVVWLSNASIAGLCSDLPGETEWYHSTIRQVNLDSGEIVELFSTDVSIGQLSASPSGNKISFPVGLASDRGVLVGDLHVLNVSTGKVSVIDTDGVDASSIQWLEEDEIVLGGLRYGRDVLLHLDLKTGDVDEVWSSKMHSCKSPMLAQFSALKIKDDKVQVAFVRHGWFSPSTLVIASPSGTHEVKAFSCKRLQDKIEKLGRAQLFKWKAPDGLDIDGYFISPSTPGPHPTLLNVHGGPVANFKPRYIGKDVQLQSLLEAGFAAFETRPRGSWGRGQWYARQVRGDMGGLDTYDHLSGLDALVAAGLADGDRLGVFGGSYGGFMSCWLITQTDRFKAANPIAITSDWVSMQYTSNLGTFCEDFLDDDVDNPTGKYFSRSPIHFVKNVKTPTLITSGGIDELCPPGQAEEFHKGLTDRGKPSVLVTYAQEGHGVRTMPAVFDFIARQVDWFKAFVL